MSRLRGFDATISVLKSLQRRAPVAALAVAEDLAKAVYKRSQELVPVSDPSEPGWKPSLHQGRPVDPGFLKESGGWGRMGDVTEATVQTVVYYDASYAVYVHEVFANHKVGQWKYLQAAVTELMPTMPDIAGRAWTQYFGHATAGARYGAYDDSGAPSSGRGTP